MKQCLFDFIIAGKYPVTYLFRERLPFSSFVLMFFITKIYKKICAILPNNKLVFIALIKR